MVTHVSAWNIPGPTNRVIASCPLQPSSVMPALVASIAYHAALGLGLAILVWTVGYGWLRLALMRGLLAPAPGMAVLSYPLGLTSVVLSAYALLVHPILGAAAIVVLLLGPPLLVCRDWALLSRGVARVGRTLVYALPFVVARRQLFLGSWLYSPLVFSHRLLAERRRLNREVLAGSRPPSSLPLAKSYDVLRGATAERSEASTVSSCLRKQRLGTVPNHSIAWTGDRGPRST